MIIFKKVRAKNFLSVGNQFLEYNLNTDHLTCLKGSNAVGKCVDGCTKVKLKNKKTGKIVEMEIGEFYECNLFFS